MSFDFGFGQHDVAIDGDYASFEGAWFRADRRGDRVWLRCQPDQRIPSGFTEYDARPWHASAFREVGAAEVSEWRRVVTVTRWKNRVWHVIGINNEGLLALGFYESTLPDYPEGSPVPPDVLWQRWPGVQWWDRDRASVEVVRGELAAARVRVTPVDAVGRAGDVEWLPLDSLLDSPFLPEGDARRLAASVLGGQEDSVDAARLRDGWWVSGPSGRVAVADDGVVEVPVEGMSDADVSLAVTAGLRDRLTVH